MWTVFPSPPKPFFLIQNSTFNPRFHRLRSQPTGNHTGDSVESDETAVKGLGLTILEAIQSSHPKPTNLNLKRRNQKQQDKEKEEKQKIGEEEAEERQISGSDVILALKKAAAQRTKLEQQKKKKKKKEISSSESGHTEDRVDIETLSPLRVKSDWAMRLNELEKRVEELSDSI